jgi:tetrapyrrole methylase family protein/MazG family protein
MHHLYIVGTGIKFISHLTVEARAHITKSEKVLFLLNDPAMKSWIQEVNPNSISLDFLYRKYDQRSDCYTEIANYIIETLKNTSHLCVVMYGHPTVLCLPALLAAKAAEQDNHAVTIFPGISGEACLFADLKIDPSQGGLQSYEATDYLVYQRQIESTSHLVLWQVGVIGALGHAEKHHNKRGIQCLTDHLLKKYPDEHEVILYEAAQYPQCEPRIEKLTLNKLIDAILTPLTTLYIPPTHSKTIDEKMVTLLRDH